MKDNNRVVFFSKRDMACGYELQKGEHILRADLQPNYTDINDILELYQLKKYIDNEIYLLSWTQDDINDFKQKVSSYGTIIGKFMSSITSENFKSTFQSISFDYKSSFWEIINDYGLFKNITKEDLLSVLNDKPFLINEILQHKKIVDVFSGRPKNQKGPNTSGNPLYPFNQMITHVDCSCKKSKYNTLVGVTVKNGRGKEYSKYRCRGCDRYLLSRDEARESIGRIVSAMELTESGRKAFQASLVDIFDQEEGDIADRMTQLYSQKANTEKEANKLMDCYLEETEPGPVKEEIKRRYETLKARVKGYEDEINTLGNVDAIELERFTHFAINFVDNLASNVLNLPPDRMQLCKQLLFPDGFFVDENKNVYTQKISPIYRLKPIKKGSEEPSNSLVVRMKRL